MNEIALDRLQRLHQLKHKVEKGLRVIAILKNGADAIYKEEAGLPDTTVLRRIEDDLDEMCCKIMDWMTDGGVK